jgi:hypothetical protein
MQNTFMQSKAQTRGIHLPNVGASQACLRRNNTKIPAVKQGFLFELVHWFGQIRFVTR